MPLRRTKRHKNWILCSKEANYRNYRNSPRRQNHVVGKKILKFVRYRNGGARIARIAIKVLVRRNATSLLRVCPCIDIRGTASQFLRAITPVYYNYATLHQRYKLLVRR